METYRVTINGRRLTKPRSLRDIHLIIYGGNWRGKTVETVVINETLDYTEETNFGVCRWTSRNDGTTWVSYRGSDDYTLHRNTKSNA